MLCFSVNNDITWLWYLVLRKLNKYTKFTNAYKCSAYRKPTHAISIHWIGKLLSLHLHLLGMPWPWINSMLLKNWAFCIVCWQYLNNWKGGSGQIESQFMLNQNFWKIEPILCTPPPPQGTLYRETALAGRLAAGTPITFGLERARRRPKRNPSQNIDIVERYPFPFLIDTVS